MKDARTIVSDGANCFINLSGNDGMATGGSGDVLSGIIGGFLAQKMDPLTAAAFGCFVHGLAGGRGPERERGLWTFSLGYYTIHVKDYPIGRKAL